MKAKRLSTCDECGTLTRVVVFRDIDEGTTFGACLACLSGGVTAIAEAIRNDEQARAARRNAADDARIPGPYSAT